MTTRAELRIKKLFDDYLDDKEHKLRANINDNALGIFLWGFIMGALFSYTSLLPFVLGTAFGMAAVRKNPYLSNYIIEKCVYVIQNGQAIINKFKQQSL